MSSTAVLRIAARASTRSTSSFFRTSYAARRVPVWASALPVTASVALGGCSSFSTTAQRRNAPGHEEETFEEFTARYEKEFESVQDVFDLQRNLNNCFAYDLVPAPEVIAAALKAARRVNDFPTAVRIFEGIKAKVENQKQYEQYVEALQGLRDELGVNLKEDLYPGTSDIAGT